MKKQQSGFTLLEIMVVMVILAALAAVVVPNILGNKDKADQKKVVVDISGLEQALDIYKLDNGSYPSTDQGLEALVQKPSEKPLPQNYRDDGYIKRLPKDPWGFEYQYTNPGSHGKIDIFSLGSDGQEEGKDSAQDIGNWNMMDIK
ncbi:MAG: type II secretion system major pseudopilin GspG [Gammaproteobacteria bacterium]|nr:type II secretion system major pseudopilin GspG [Gammaproteobacteria bacterium]